MKLINFFQFFPCKKAYYVKNQDLKQKFKTAIYGLVTEPEPEP